MHSILLPALLCLSKSLQAGGNKAGNGPILKRCLAGQSVSSLCRLWFLYVRFIFPSAIRWCLPVKTEQGCYKPSYPDLIGMSSRLVWTKIADSSGVHDIMCQECDTTSTLLWQGWPVWLQAARHPSVLDKDGKTSPNSSWIMWLIIRFCHDVADRTVCYILKCIN